MRPPVPELLLITDPGMPGGIVPTIQAALEGAPAGRVGVQLRARGASGRALVALGRSLRAITRDAGAALLVNGRADVAIAIEADGVHLPESGLRTDDARALLGDDRLVGRSCHDRAGLEAAAATGADYATLSPVFAVPGKGPPLEIAGFEASCRGASLPVLALGGIRAEAVGALRAAGAHGVAIIRAMGNPAVARANVQDFLTALDTSRPGTR